MVKHIGKVFEYFTQTGAKRIATCKKNQVPPRVR